jgi:hypothetical protein
MAGLSLALFGQYLLEPTARIAPAIVFYIAAAGFIGWGILQNEWRLPDLPEVSEEAHVKQPNRPQVLIALVLLLTAFHLFGDNRFTALNLFLWVSGILAFVHAFWMPGPSKSFTRQIDWEWMALLAAVLLLAAFFRFHRIYEVPAEPFSDHAEKLLDIYDISRGKTSIFFERNTGREAFQMYWTLAVSNIFNTGLSFLSLKIGTALLGFLALPFVYLLGREFGGAFTGFFALFIFGVAYWPNVISRIGLRFPLYPLFGAATLLYLVRGLRTLSQNDLLLCGLFLGLGLHGYSPFRMMPLVVVIGFLIFILHARSVENRRRAWWWLALVAITALIVFLPLLRYALQHPDLVGFRALSRLGFAGREIPGEPVVVFLSNFVRGMLMFNWDDGDVWVNSIPHRPALDVVTAALFAIGMLLLIVQYTRHRDWRDLFLPVSIPLLLMPSILSLAFPIENPALNRAGGAAVAAALVCARALDGWVAGFGTARKRSFVGYFLAALLLSAAVWQNYDLVFKKFDASYRLAVWNSSEMADVIRDHGDLDTAWIVPYPQWVDTRLPAIWLGKVDGDLALWPHEFEATKNVSGPKIFLFKPEDFETEKALKQLYPDGTLSRYTSASIAKDFMVFHVEE